MNRETALFVIMLIGAAGALFDLRTGYMVTGIAIGALLGAGARYDAKKMSE